MQAVLPYTSADSLLFIPSDSKIFSNFLLTFVETPIIIDTNKSNSNTCDCTAYQSAMWSQKKMGSKPRTERCCRCRETCSSVKAGHWGNLRRQNRISSETQVRRTASVTVVEQKSTRSCCVKAFAAVLVTAAFLFSMLPHAESRSI